ncbi:hypothetical protein KW791_02285 [Candidatus Parcubacteria bacterium]|nr:hypothetical protein [Candidatus Parcubacteria bacterium]
MPERIKLAAILCNGKIYTGKRHNLIIREIVEKTQAPAKGEQGFVTEEDRFVSRSEAAKIAFAAGQIITPKDILYSEDVIEL